MKTIRIAEQFGIELRSRSNAARIKDLIGKNDETILDMSDVEFISRSFADELCCIIDEFNVKLNNVSSFVTGMMNIVSAGRKRERIRKTDNSEIVELENLEELKHFLLNEC